LLIGFEVESMICLKCILRKFNRKKFTNTLGFGTGFLNYIKTAAEEFKEPAFEYKTDEIMWQDRTKYLKPNKRLNKTPVTLERK